MVMHFCPDCGTTLAGPRKFCKVCRLSFSDSIGVSDSMPVIVKNTDANSVKESDNSGNALALFAIGAGLFLFSLILVTPIFFAGIFIMIFISLIFMGVMIYYQMFKGGRW